METDHFITSANSHWNNIFLRLEGFRNARLAGRMVQAVGATFARPRRSRRARMGHTAGDSEFVCIPRARQSSSRESSLTLHSASESGDEEAVRRLLTDGADVQARDKACGRPILRMHGKNKRALQKYLNFFSSQSIEPK